MRSFVRFVRRIRLLEVNIYAAYASYFIVLSIFPAMMLTVSILQYTPLSAGDLQALLGQVVPDSLHPLLDYMTEELFAVNSAAVLSLSAVTALWMASKGVLSIQRGLNKVYTATETRSILAVRLQCVGFTLLLVLSLLVTGAIYLGGQSLRQALEASGSALGLVLLRVVRLRYLITVASLTLFFCGIYCIFPNKKIRFSAALPGAFLSSVLWVIFSQLFSIYVDRFGNYSLYYGSLSVMALAMLWLYTCMFILFCGGILNCELERLRNRRQRMGAQNISKENPR